MSLNHSNTNNNISQPAYYAIIPANVRYCKNLEPNAKLLYGEITALCNKEGYCWASNQYFSELYDVDIRTVQRWIESLKSNHFIHVEIEKDGFQTSRKIWISEEIKKSFTTRQKCHTEVTKMSYRGDKNVIHNNTSNITIEKQQPDQRSAKEKKQKNAPSAVVVSSSLDKLNINDSLKKKLLKNWSIEEIDKAVDRVLKWSKRKSDSAAIQSALKDADLWEDSKTQEEIANENLEILKSLSHLDKRKFGACTVNIGHNYIEFDSYPKIYIFYINEKDFKKKVNEKLVKYNILSL